MKTNLNEIYDVLFDYYGPQGWWPGEGLEIAVGAVLTQQTNWQNVEKAITHLKDANCLNIDCLKRIPLVKLESLIRSSGYYKVKARRLKSLIELLARESRPDRDTLLAVDGLGYETVDCIMLYWFEKPYFVIDAYTFRIFRRLGYYEGKDYLELQRVFMETLPSDVQLYNEYHALIIAHAKKHCLKTKPKCESCPLLDYCLYTNEPNI
ncbi:MAG: hypothetical protein KGD64_05320 [Candidatus Heimdallarchaeota archaeon]|nr:hypothetical protein [Candidatus Heimdallarchaeota archaeon]